MVNHVVIYKQYIFSRDKRQLAELTFRSWRTLKKKVFLTTPIVPEKGNCELSIHLPKIECSLNLIIIANLFSSLNFFSKCHLRILFAEWIRSCLVASGGWSRVLDILCRKQGKATPWKHMIYEICHLFNMGLGIRS